MADKRISRTGAYQVLQVEGGSTFVRVCNVFFLLGTCVYEYGTSIVVDMGERVCRDVQVWHSKNITLLRTESFSSGLVILFLERSGVFLFVCLFFHDAGSSPSFCGLLARC